MKSESFRKTEKVLYEYQRMKEFGIESQYLDTVEKILKSLADEVYYDIIPMKYFHRMTHEQIAEHFDVQPATISKQRTRLIKLIAPILFPSDFFNEIFAPD